MIIKILFSSAQTLHRPWPPILISVLFHPGLFKVLARSFFYTQGVFVLDIYIYSGTEVSQIAIAPIVLFEFIIAQYVYSKLLLF